MHKRKMIILYKTILLSIVSLSGYSQQTTQLNKIPNHTYNGSYKEECLSKIAFPIGGMGAGMFCIEGTGSISHMSVKNNPEIFNEPIIFAAIKIKGTKYEPKVLEGPVPDWKKFGMYGASWGALGADWGLARFQKAVFNSKFPFATIELNDKELPLEVNLTAWSPFIPTDADNSSLPVGAIEYSFKNINSISQEYIFSFNSKNFMTIFQYPGQKDSTIGPNKINSFKNGFILSQEGTGQAPENQGDFAIFTNDSAAIINYSWFRGGWNDPITMAWNELKNDKITLNPPLNENARGASIFVPFKLKPGEKKTIRIMMAWYVPNTKMRLGESMTQNSDSTTEDLSLKLPSQYHKPWYSSHFTDINDVCNYWIKEYGELKNKTKLFTEAFYRSTLPSEVTEAVGANLSILKSPTVMRQYDGRLWAWEGCRDTEGSCEGSCTHVWNYAQAICHLFPKLETTLRNTEFWENQDKDGHQSFRAALPIRPLTHKFYAAADGQLGGIMKVYREWRINDDTAWLRKIYPQVKKSLDYCIKTWDPKHKGIIEEPHHNTYDIEFWGPDPMCTSIYLGALNAFIFIGRYMGDTVNIYQQILHDGRTYMEKQLFNGEYFVQDIQWKGLNAHDPVEASKMSFGITYSEEGLALLQKEGPKYQYGNGCLSDGIIGSWMTEVCGLPEMIDREKVKSHLLSVYKYNFKPDLTWHSNPQRSTFALGHEGGLLLCSWPKGNALSLPFPYSGEVWTGIEYQVASHLIFTGYKEEGLKIVRACRARYDGSVRNPYDEYECGHWYARALASYALIEALTGVKYDAVDKTLYVNSKVGNFTSFLSTATGFGNVVYKNGKANLDIVYGTIPISRIIINKS